jgi:HAD superfamily hydrolase (TIGR01458 family)
MTMAVKGLLLDIAGVIMGGNRLLPGAAEALDALRRGGWPLRFVTNTSRRTRRDLVAGLVSLGIEVAPEEVYTAPLAARDWLAARGLRPLLLIHPALAPDFEGLPTGEPNAVFVADAAEGFRYESLNEAFRLLHGGAPLVAVGRNRYFREEGGLSLDAGPFVAALEYAAGVDAVVIGKPAPEFFRAAVTDLGLAPAEVLMVGDDVEADVVGAVEAGLRGALVRTGKYEPGDEDRLTVTGAACYDTLHDVIKDIYNN